MKNAKDGVEAYVKVPGSTKASPLGHRLDTMNPNDAASITIRVRRQKSIDEAVKKGQRISREEYAAQYGASDDDIAMVEAFAAANHLSVVESDKGRRSVILKGRVGDLENAFKVHLTDYKDERGIVFRGRSGDICIPSSLDGIVEGVFGLDNRPHVKPHFQLSRPEGPAPVPLVSGVGFSPHVSNGSFDPNQLSIIYGFPKGVTGKNQCIGIIELGGGYRNEDLNTYFSGLNITTPSVKAISVDGATNSPTTANSADGEVMLDIEVAGAVAPDASIVVYFAPNTDQGFLDAITQAIHDTQNQPSVISISWGGAEVNWTQQSLTSFNSAFQSASLLGVTVCVAAGDTGSDDSVGDGNVHVDFPASSPYVLACGGTNLVADGTVITSETVWHEAANSATGGGVSDFFPIPDYQSNANVPLSIDTQFNGRGVPDVAGDADPASGYNVRVDGQDLVIGGTSAVAPLMAGFIALVNEKNGKAAGFINPQIYAAAGSCRDITQGDNITTTTNKGYVAGPGWDACTGLGVLNNL